VVTSALCSCWSSEADRLEKVSVAVAVTVVAVAAAAAAAAAACVAAVDARFL